MSFFTREQCLQRLRAQIAAGKPIIGGGAGTGISAKCAEAGGIDLIIIYNSGRYRMAGRGSAAGLLAYGNANDIVKDMAREVLPVVRSTPVLAGVKSAPTLSLSRQKRLGQAIRIMTSLRASNRPVGMARPGASVQGVFMV